ncbi:MAG: TIGR04283 family arsenosugar biosynthesis glycosyltransferase [Methyloprofundus sp.]
MRKFSIIIPTLNEATDLSDFLLALQPLRKHCEIIIADAGSTDDTHKISIGLVDQFIISARGRALQMNAGAKQVSAEILIFLHADTYLPAQALQSIQQGIDRGAQWGRFDIHLTGKSPLLKMVAQMMNWRSRLSGIATGDQAIFITSKVFESVGGFPEIALMEDIELSKRLKYISPPYCIKSKVKSSARRWAIFGVWRTIILMWRLRLLYFFGVSPEKLARLYRQEKCFKP